MSRILIRIRTADGSETRYRCPLCGNYRKKEEILWQRSPGREDPGKIGHCRFCSWPEEMAFINATPAGYPAARVPI